MRVRLVNGTDSCSGRVEVHRLRQWGTVCDHSWDLRDAQVVCRELGCGAALDALPGGYFGRGSGQVLMDAMQCVGNEESVMECKMISIRPHCFFHGGASVICARGARLRLVNGVHKCSGRVEVYQSSHWGTVCDDDWDLGDAQVVCRELGCGVALNATGESSFGIGVGMPVLMDNVWCTGTEGSLLDCPSLSFWQHNCAHNEEAGVVCAGQRAGELLWRRKQFTGSQKRRYSYLVIEISSSKRRSGYKRQSQTKMKR
ncbi:hypothetical protein Z043_106205 [Scleropages formosus]|uniref:Soluble scavenger receptor cysteine-rich domain-containing protein SSC5D n=1 Tax=Scleropages formosus TaxID=113540 RepID=A0A0P7XH12_SCLFO|nr:hypothetical protein Z043_106205 [Scleropages formosus]